MGLLRHSRADWRVRFSRGWYDATHAHSDFKTSHHYPAGCPKQHFAGVATAEA
jgi:hypothetical protein